MNQDTLAAYYADIATTYDSRYEDADRQDDLDELHERIAELVSNHKVLELGCGTGYWTETLACSADSVLAIDSSPEMLEMARQRVDAASVEFQQADAFALPDMAGRFTACFAGFLWSHIKREDQEKYLKQLRARLGKDVLLILVDDNFMEEQTPPIARTDLEGNTFQIFTAPSGKRYEVLRNYPADSSLRKRFASHVREVRIERLDHYWMLTGRLK
ncbi:class I SAM-dependent methyltransferase [Pseudoduganella sp. GCM10020061]|uniref:class I SAM-dependent methyltransferase n=1 Tax=Pseudoduganella sp. GCM10020061 TaxID=3317345 RepID=UPI00363B2289